ncbi:TPA: hypothetical protein ACU9T0_006544 [Burkholderia cenocepacia]
MSNANHTPGPWKFSRWDEFGDIRFYISQQDGAPYTPDYSDVATVIAETCSGERMRIQEANARVIAAAPELLEAAQKLVDMYDAHFRLNDYSALEVSKHHVDELADAFEAARTALAKARGAA